MSLPKAQDPMTLIHELVKAISLYSNSRAGHQSHLYKNSNFKPASKKMWMQKTHHKWAFLTWSLCFISWFFGQFVLFRIYFLHFILGLIRMFLSFFFKIKNKKQLYCTPFSVWLRLANKTLHSWLCTLFCFDKLCFSLH